MTGKQADIRVCCGPGPQPAYVRPQDQPVEPLGCDIELGVARHRVAALEEPAIAVLDGDPAVAAGVSKERHEVHRGREGEAECLEAQPLGIGRVIENPSRPVREVARS